MEKDNEEKLTRRRRGRGQGPRVTGKVVLSDALARQLAVRKCASSGLTEAQMDALGMTPVVDSKHALLRMPHLDLDGRPVTATHLGQRVEVAAERYLEDEARGIQAPPDPNKPGKRKRYRMPAGIRPHLYFPHGLLPQSWRAIADGEPQTIYTMEGQLKAAAGCALGVPCVAISGVDNVASKKRGIDLLPEFVEFCRRGFPFAIVFDNDVASKPQVRRARMRLRDKLLAHGCPDVRVVELPPGPAKGLDDYLVAHGADATRMLLGAALPAEDVDPPDRADIAVIHRAVEGQWGIRAAVPELAGQLELNLLTKTVTAGRKPVDVEQAVHRLRVEAARQHRLRFAKNDTWDAVVAVAKEHAYHPVADYLGRLPAWDGRTDWAEQLATKAMRLPPTDVLSRTLLKKFLIAAVARALDPGCKVDTVLVLIGPQGKRKSSFFYELAGGAEFFGDTPVNLRDKDSYLALHKVWIYEWGELETKRRAADTSVVKTFLTGRHDIIRPPYGRTTEAMPRSCIIVGTTNEDTFLDDPTGSRRFWPVSVPDKLDLDWLRANRDSVWAQAVALYRAGEAWWVDDDDAVAAQLRVRHEEHREIDPLEEGAGAAVEAARNTGGATSDEVLAFIHGDSKNYVGRKDLYRRVREILRSRGYMYRRWSDAGARDACLRWRHLSWDLPKRGNPSLASATVTPLHPESSADVPGPIPTPTVRRPKYVDPPQRRKS